MESREKTNKIIRISAVMTILGILLSGPIGMLITLVKPQPAWVNVDTFVNNYSPIQKTPYAFGFILIFGFSLFIIAVSRLASTESEKIYSILAIVFTAVFATMIGLNYTIQVAYVPILVTLNKEVATLFTMSNPKSISWVLEMFGYGFLGISTWLVAPLFKNGQRMNCIRYLLKINGASSLLGAALTAWDVSWLMKLPGLISFGAWNLLIILIMWLVLIEFRAESCTTSPNNSQNGRT